MELLESAKDLARDVAALAFANPVTHVYNPLDYAWAAHEQYVRRYGKGRRDVVLLGMNPGPWGMAQTGVPFGSVPLVRDWLGIEAPVGRPAREHPKRPVEGFACPRVEVSGKRLWGWARDRFSEPERFFERFYVLNYCPLIFLEKPGRNRVPDKLPAGERAPLFEACDRHLVRAIRTLQPKWAIGVGKFAEARLREALGEVADGNGMRIGSVLHPSPANPRAHNWAESAEDQFKKLGIKI